jgi:hypothetical protein
MIDLNKEAEEYADFKHDYVPMCFGNKFNKITKRDFIAGANSKYVKQQILQAQIDFITNEMVAINWDIRKIYVEELQEQLKKLQDE